jgi:hypothetical protein
MLGGDRGFSVGLQGESLHLTVEGNSERDGKRK